MVGAIELKKGNKKRLELVRNGNGGKLQQYWVELSIHQGQIIAGVKVLRWYGVIAWGYFWEWSSFCICVSALISSLSARGSIYEWKRFTGMIITLMFEKFEDTFLLSVFHIDKHYVIKMSVGTLPRTASTVIHNKSLSIFRMQHLQAVPRLQASLPGKRQLNHRILWQAFNTVVDLRAKQSSRVLLVGEHAAQRSGGTSYPLCTSVIDPFEPIYTAII